MRVGIALGSNQGDRWANLRRARELILRLPGIGASCVCAPMYETEPVGCPPGAEPFLNTVIEIETSDDQPPRQLLGQLREIERCLGRPTRYPRNAPRPVDLDILYAEDLVEHTAALTLPHPRLHTRRFVLAPLADIHGNLVLPGQTSTVAEHLRALPDDGKIQQVRATW